jgi:hypothetical protein
MTLEEMTVQRVALLGVRFRGVGTVEMDGRHVTFGSASPVLHPDRPDRRFPRQRQPAIRNGQVRLNRSEFGEAA